MAARSRSISTTLALLTNGGELGTPLFVDYVYLCVFIYVYGLAIVRGVVHHCITPLFVDYVYALAIV